MWVFGHDLTKVIDEKTLQGSRRCFVSLSSGTNENPTTSFAHSTEQIRRFVDTARLPASPVAEIIRDTARLTVEAWKALPEKDLLPEAMQSTIGKQIERVAAAMG